MQEAPKEEPSSEHLSDDALTAIRELLQKRDAYKNITDDEIREMWDVMDVNGRAFLLREAVKKAKGIEDTNE